MTTDISILPVAQELLTCFCAAVATVPNPPATCCFRTGQQVAAGISINEDECCTGLAWVRVVSSFPSEINFPEQDGAPNGNCPPGWLAVILEMGVMRCVPTGDAFDLPECAAWNLVFADVMHDDAAMREAFCCLGDAPTSNIDGAAKVLGVWEPLATEGGCTGGTRTVTVHVPTCLDC